MKVEKTIKIIGTITATIRDAKTKKIKRIYQHKNVIMLAGRSVIARRLANELTFSGVLNYGSLFTAGPTEHFRKLSASGTYDDATAKAYVTWFFTAAEVSGTFVQWSNWIDGTATFGTGKEWSRVEVNWVKTTTETLTIDCVYQITSA